LSDTGFDQKRNHSLQKQSEFSTMAVGRWALCDMPLYAILESARFATLSALIVYLETERSDPWLFQDQLSDDRGALANC
jgi:hypothetical protein